jgi:hypothetical protein
LVEKDSKTDLSEPLCHVGCSKSEELVATPSRHGGKDKAEAFFLMV